MNYMEIDLDKINCLGAEPSKEPERQYYFMAKCREWVKAKEEETGKPLTFITQTFGCQMNAKDSEKLAGILEFPGQR